MITGLTHAAVRVTDLSKSIEFYCGKLGLEEQFSLRHDNGEAWLVYLRITDRQFIELFPGAEGPHVGPSGAGLVHICLEVDDIQATYSEMTSRGVVANGEPVFAADNSWQFWTADPDGNPIEFHQFTAESRQVTG